MRCWVIKDQKTGQYKRATSQNPKWTNDLTMAMTYSIGRAKAVISGMTDLELIRRMPVAVEIEMREVPIPHMTTDQQFQQ